MPEGQAISPRDLSIQAITAFQADQKGGMSGRLFFKITQGKEHLSYEKSEGAATLRARRIDQKEAQEIIHYCEKEKIECNWLKEHMGLLKPAPTTDVVKGVFQSSRKTWGRAPDIETILEAPKSARTLSDLKSAITKLQKEEERKALSLEDKRALLFDAVTLQSIDLTKTVLKSLSSEELLSILHATNETGLKCTDLAISEELMKMLKKKEQELVESVVKAYSKSTGRALTPKIMSEKRDLTPTDNLGWMDLMKWAIENAKTDFIKSFLLRVQTRSGKEALQTARLDAQGRTALQIAEDAKKSEIVALLKDKLKSK
jgi:hypothetical protein